MENGFEQDEFGFKKIIFGLTRQHTTISAISTKTGYVEWNINLEKDLESTKFISDSVTITYSQIFVIEKEQENDELVVLFENS